MSLDADELHRRHMLAAIEAAREGMLSGKGGPFGALITDPAGRVVSVAPSPLVLPSPFPKLLSWSLYKVRSVPGSRWRLSPGRSKGEGTRAFHRGY